MYKKHLRKKIMNMGFDPIPTLLHFFLSFPTLTKSLNLRSEKHRAVQQALRHAALQRPMLGILTSLLCTGSVSVQLTVWTITLEKASFLERPFEEEELLLFGGLEYVYG
jgi:hypothetical protein